jgi:uncharacterized lipoprotein YddW (UPF0748 family)
MAFRPCTRREWRSRLSWPERSRPSTWLEATLSLSKGRRQPRRIPIPLAALLLSLAVSSAAAQPATAPELRALWVDAFHAGIRSPEEAAQLVADAKRIHVNTLIVQVRRRGDALYTGGLEPPLDDANYQPSFDALAHIVSAAHAAGLQVHAWINAMPVWRDETPPKDARHVFNLHGPAAAGDACWLTSARDGTKRFPVGFFLDPGHPAAQNHLVSVYLDIVRRYGVDGLHFDYIRYPETEGQALPRGADVGYNPVSVARFQRATGRSDVPAPDDESWTRWRRQQVTQLVQRISIEARAIRPRIKISAATIAWGRPPASLADFENVAPMQRVFQDWQGWLSEGLLDLAVPMNYAREHDDRVRGWFNGWIAWEKRYKADRQVAVGIGAYLSAPDGVLAQVSRVRAAEGRARADGMSFFSYYQPSTGPPVPPGAPAAAVQPGSTPPPQAPPPPAAAPERLDYLIRGAGAAPAVFTAPAPVPPMPWIERPTHGFIAGSVSDAAGATLERRTVRIRRTGWFRRTRKTTSDANGWFGMTKVAPGRNRVQLEDARGKATRERVTIVVTPGAVARVALASK